MREDAVLTNRQPAASHLLYVLSPRTKSGGGCALSEEAMNEREEAR